MPALKRQHAKRTRCTVTWHGLVAIAMLLAGCGDDARRTLVPGVSSCSSGWQPIRTASDGFYPPSLVLAEGTLVFRVFEGSVGEPYGDAHSVIKTLSLSDGLERTLVQDAAELLWIEGDSLLYSHLERRDSLFKVPLRGGTPALLLDTAYDRAGSYPFHTGLDARHYYWVDPLDLSDQNFSIWRMARDGGDAQRFASLEGFRGITRVWLGQEVLIAADDGKSTLLPLDGGAAVPLAEVASVSLSPLGIDALGSYWARSTSGDGARESDVEIVRAPITGGPPEVFWPSKPEGLVPQGVWPDGQGGWLVSGSEPFDDGLMHATSWLVDADQNGRLAACDPRPGDSANLTPPVFSSDAVYQVVSHADDWATWSIVEVLRN